MKIKLTFLFIFLGISAFAAGPRSYGTFGTATDVNVTLTLPFYPASLCVHNDGATNELFIDWTDGVAAASGGTTNQQVAKAEALCWEFKSPNVLNTFTLGLICAAGETTTYRVNAIAAR